MYSASEGARAWGIFLKENSGGWAFLQFKLQITSLEFEMLKKWYLMRLAFLDHWITLNLTTHNPKTCDNF